MRCVLATCQPFLHASIPDDDLLLDALQACNVQAERIAWEDATYPWEQADVVVIRSTWNSHLLASNYRNWANLVASRSKLLNPLPAILWNMEKSHYFRDLSNAGVPLVPTLILPYGALWNIAKFLQERHWHKAVLKPSIGANSFSTVVVELLPDGRVEGVPENFPACDMLLQPYLETIETTGERSHVFLAGRWSHCFRKVPFAIRSDHAPIPTQEKIITPVIQEIELARSIFQCVERLLSTQLLYARVDLVENKGQLCLMEVEINEPALHLEEGGAASRLANAIIITCYQSRKEKKTDRELFLAQSEKRYHKECV